MTISATRAGPTFEGLATAAVERLARNKPVRRNLPGDGRLRVDRQLPFLCVYRAPPSRTDPGTRELVTTEASYVFASGQQEYRDGLAFLCRQIAATLQEHFGMVLIVEIWSEEPTGSLSHQSPNGAPVFRIVTSDAEALPTLVGVFRRALEEIHVRRHAAIVDIAAHESVAPPGLPPLFDGLAAGSKGCIFLGLAVRPVYRDPHSGQLYPIVLQRLRQQLAPALRKAFAAFAGIGRDDALPHYQSFGPTSLIRAVQASDEQLCAVAGAFDFVYQVTPTNAEIAWRRFAATHYEEPPTFWYRPLPYDPNLLKRTLFRAPLERIEDTTVAHLLAEKQSELDRQLTALGDIETPNFLYGSLQLYGRPDEKLVELAHCLLERHPPPDGDREETAALRPAGASEVAAAAGEEIAAYQRAYEEFNATVEVCDDIASGLMVTRERLLIARSVQIPRHRLTALLDHEVGIHLLTYFNGRAQPFRQLRTGLAGCEPLQEGLAVLAEYLAGGLTHSRLRQLAGRVVAVHALCQGAELIETFRLLHREWGFDAHCAFTIALRVHRGGGLTKDQVYLRGVRDALDYVGQGHDLEPLLVGKIALEHVPFVQELRRRGIIRPPAVLPRLLQREAARHKLEQLRGASLLDLCGILA